MTSTSIELNEAFAVQVLACARELGIPMEKLNPNGGAVALGHPIGSSGARITTTLVHELQRRRVRYGLATMCIGVGQGIAMIIERVDTRLKGSHRRRHRMELRDRKGQPITKGTRVRVDGVEGVVGHLEPGYGVLTIVIEERTGKKEAHGARLIR